MRNGTATSKNYAVPHTIDMSVLLLQQGPVHQGRPRPGEAADDADRVRRRSAASRRRSSAATSTAPTSAATAAAATCSPCGRRSGPPAARCMNADGTAGARSTPRTMAETSSTSTAALRRGRRRARVQGRGRARPGPARSPSGKVGIDARRRRDARHHRGQGHARSASRRSPASTAASRRSSAATSIGIGATSKNAARPGTSSPGRCRDEAQVEVVAKGKGVPSRTDLADNKYSAEDPRLVTINKLVGQGQDAVREELQRHLQRPAGPWLTPVARRAVRRRAKSGRRAQRRASPRRCRRWPAVSRGGRDRQTAAPARASTRAGAGAPRSGRGAAARRRSPSGRGLRRADRGRWWACSSWSRWGWSCWMSLHHWPLLGAPTFNAPGELHRPRRRPAVPRRRRASR